jgi:ketosteroid isomerase-like protein
MKTAALLLSVLLTMPLLAKDRADEVREAEAAFAQAFADRNQDKFFSFVADDAHFIGQRRTMTNKKEVIEVWSNYLKEPKAPFSWKPERVFVNGTGDIGLSTGPIYDPDGKHIGNFSSVWQRQKDGKWLVIFDGPGSGPPCDQK